MDEDQPPDTVEVYLRILTPTFRSRDTLVRPLPVGALVSEVREMFIRSLSQIFRRERYFPRKRVKLYQGGVHLSGRPGQRITAGQSVLLIFRPPDPELARYYRRPDVQAQEVRLRYHYHPELIQAPGYFSNPGSRHHQ